MEHPVNKLDPEGASWASDTVDALFGEGTFEGVFGKGSVEFSDTVGAAIDFQLGGFSGLHNEVTRQALPDAETLMNPEWSIDFGLEVAGMIPVGKIGSTGLKGVMGVAEGSVDATKAARTADRFSSEKEALVEMAKKDKKTGMTEADLEAYKELNRGLPDPFPESKVRGPEQHSSGLPSSQQPHAHVGPVGHIPIRNHQ